MTMTKKRIVIIAAACSINASCTASEVPANWKSECVGRLQLSLPSEADIAALPKKIVIEDFKKGFPQPGYTFTDGQRAGWSAYNYRGRFTISHPLGRQDREDVKAAMDEAWIAGNFFQKRNKIKSVTLSVSPYSGRAEIAGDHLYVQVFVGDAFVDLASHVPGATFTERQIDFERFLSGLSPRPFGTVPTRPGICLPNLFIADDGKEGRSIGTTYRLKAHPDITIWLEDSYAALPGPGQNPDKFTAKSKSEFFWTQDYGDFQRESVSSYWSPPYRSQQFAGSPGVESFVKLIRKDGTEDFGYLAVARGTPDATDKPDVMLYVIRDAKNAKAKGIEPMSKDEFLKMARAIADSVHYRN